MAEYDSAIALATRLITKKGEACTLRHFLPGTVNVAQPWRPVAVSPDHTDVPVRAAWIPLTNPLTPPVQYDDGTLSKIGDCTTYTDATVAPKLGDRFIRGNGSVWTVKKMTPLDPGGRLVITTCWVSQ